MVGERSRHVKEKKIVEVTTQNGKIGYGVRDLGQEQGWKKVTQKHNDQEN